jgi:hypothetical protein
VDLEEMAAEQSRFLETQHLLGGTSLKLAFRQTGAQRLAGDVSNFRPIVPLKFRKNIFGHFHNVAHPGRLASRRIISCRFVWRGLSSDFTAWARGCLACQRGKIHRHTRLVPLPIPIPQLRCSHLHIDLVGPLQYSNNFNYIFTIIDHTSKWMEAIPLSETSAAACAKALTFTWISRFGVPETITSDRGPQFISNLWFQLCEMLNISHKQTTVGAVFRVAGIIRVAAGFGALKIIFSDLFFLHDNLQVGKNQNQKTNFEKCFFMPFFLAQSQNPCFS